MAARAADMFSFLSRKAEPKAPEVRRIPRKQLDAIMGGAKAAMRELTEFAKHAKSRLRDERPIVQDELLELLRMLVAAQKRIDAQMSSYITKSDDISDSEWDRRSYNLFVVPISQMANSPQALADLTVAASDIGAKDVKLLYELTVAEMDVAVARFNVTLNSVLPYPWRELGGDEAKRLGGQHWSVVDC